MSEEEKQAIAALSEWDRVHGGDITLDGREGRCRLRAVDLRTIHALAQRTLDAERRAKEAEERAEAAEREAGEDYLALRTERNAERARAAQAERDLAEARAALAGVQADRDEALRQWKAETRRANDHSWARGLAEKALAGVREAGTRLANLAYNAAQSPNVSEQWQRCFDTGRREWDAVVAGLTTTGGERCEVCGSVLAATYEMGCVRGDCTEQPPAHEYAAPRETASTEGEHEDARETPWKDVALAVPTPPAESTEPDARQVDWYNDEPYACDICDRYEADLRRISKAWVRWAEGEDSAHDALSAIGSVVCPRRSPPESTEPPASEVGEEREVREWGVRHERRIHEALWKDTVIDQAKAIVAAIDARVRLERDRGER